MRRQAARSVVLVLLLASAAALAAEGGWYLMVPPAIENKRESPYVDTKAPLSKWALYTSYDSADACERARRSFLSEQIQLSGKFDEYTAGKPLTEAMLTLRGDRDRMVEMFSGAHCIATNDPRLTPPR